MLCNSYEERSLGVFEAPPDDEDEEPSEELKAINSRKERIGRYLGWHLRRQTSIGEQGHFPISPILSQLVHYAG
jgi:hypothetical protein